MTSILEHPEDKNLIDQSQRWHNRGKTNEQLSVVSLKMEFDVGVPSNKLTQRSSVQREKQRAEDKALGYSKQ